MIFASIVFIMLLLAIASVAWPLLRQVDPARGINKAAFRAHYKQLRALEQQLKRGELDTAGYLAARRQMEEAFQTSLSEPDHGSQPVARARPRRWTALAASILIPLLAVGLYLAIGNWRLATGSEQAATQRSINQMV
ncbi:MAG TPA: c-type cytochrome biogenesis protein CcmI, partial [Gammaproteobacteria bacterium]